MAEAVDVAVYILEERGPMPAMKLQKLAYYSHAWHLVWEDEPLLSEAIEAWANGPVIRDLYRRHRLQFTVDVSTFPEGHSSSLEEHEKSSVDAVLGFYGDRSAHELSQLTHREAPWRDARARAGLKTGERGDERITDAEMAEYYGGLVDV